MINAQTLSVWWDVFKAPDRLTEVRILAEPKVTYSGYFRDKETMIAEIQRCENLGGIYATINEIHPDCYGRRQYNKIVKSPKSTTNDSDIVRRRILFIDFDPKRPSDTNATEEQLVLAESRMKATVKHLQSVGFPNPVIAMSGNGYHCYYKVDLPNDAETKSLFERFFQSLDKSFGGNGVDIDNTVFNASRIAKIIGATSTKGADTPERPQRESAFIYIPKDFTEVPVELIMAVADEYPAPERSARSASPDKKRFPIDEFLEKHGIEVARRQEFNGGEKIVLAECPFDPNHRDFALFIYDDGGVAASCFHHSCSSHGWRDFIEHFEPDYFESRQYEQRPTREYTPKQPPKPVPEDGRGKKWKRAFEIEYIDPNSIVYIPSGLAKFDSRSRGFALGEFSILSGLSGAGKSTILNHFILSAREAGFKSAIWSGELIPQRLISWLDQVAAGPDFVKQSNYGDDNYYTPKMTCDKINAWLGDYLFVYNNDYGERWSQLLSDITECVRENGVKLVLIDNLMSLTLDTFDGDKNEKQSLFAKGLASLAKSEQIHIILVCHPRKEQSFQLLRKESIAGTADLTNACDNLFLLHRGGPDFEKRASEFFGDKKTEEMKSYDLVLEVNKNRMFGKVDYLDGLFYEAKSRRILNYIDEKVIYGWVGKEEQQKIPVMEDMPDFESERPNDPYDNNF